MPQTAEPIPAVPDWLQTFSSQAACQITQSG